LSQDNEPKFATPAKRDTTDGKGAGLPAPPRPPAREPAPPVQAEAASASPPIAPELEEVSGALLIEDSSPELPAPPPPSMRVSKPPPPPISRMTAGGTLRPAPAQPTPPAPIVAEPRETSDRTPETPHPPAAGTPQAASSAVPADPPTERSLPAERESALKLPTAWAGVAAGALRDAVHKAGDSLRPTAHALRDAVPKIRESLAPAANAIREVLPKIIPESLRSPASSSSGAPPRSTLLAFGVVGLLLGIAIAVPAGMLLRRGSGKPSAETPSAAPQLAASALTPQAAREAALSSCRLAGAPRTLAAKATVAAGVEARAFGSDLALGYAASDSDGVVLRLDPTSLSILATVTGTSKSPIRRVSPVVSPGGAIGLAVDADRKGDAVRSRRTVSVDPPLQIGVSAGNLVWAQSLGGPITGKLWPIDGHGEIDSMRSVEGEVAGESILALVFSRKNVVGVGLARAGDAPAAKGSLAYFSGLGPVVGAPAVAVNEGAVVAAWADRTGPDAAWGLRLARFDGGESAGEPRTFALPAGGKGGPAISPAIAALPQKGFLFVWSEGPAAGRVVRAVTLTASGETTGAAMDLSNAGANAGQPQAAVDASGHGVVAFLQSAGGAFELVATPIACGL